MDDAITLAASGNEEDLVDESVSRSPTATSLERTESEESPLQVEIGARCDHPRKWVVTVMTGRIQLAPCTVCGGDRQAEDEHAQAS